MGDIGCVMEREQTLYSYTVALQISLLRSFHRNRLFQMSQCPLNTPWVAVLFVVHCGELTDF